MTDEMKRKIQEHSDVKSSLHGELGQAEVPIPTVVYKRNHNHVQTVEGTPGEKTLIEVQMMGSSLLKAHHSFGEVVDKVGCTLLGDNWVEDEKHLVDFGCTLLGDN